MGVIVGIDYGLKRIGVAVSDEGKRMAFPLRVLPHASWGEDIKRLRDVLSPYVVDKIALGDPINDTVYRNDESGGAWDRQSRETRGFGERLIQEGFDVEYVDESYTSAEALELIHESGHNKRRRGGANAKGRTDMAAAALILQRYLDDKCK